MARFEILDRDIQGGLKLEAGERSFVREQHLRRYAKGLGRRATQEQEEPH
jgi:hypothetical protein